MKKIIGIFIAVLLLSLCLSFPVCGADVDFTLAEDYTSITYDGVTYLRTDLSAVSINYYNGIKEQPQLTARQQEQLRSYEFRRDSSKTVLEADFHFTDGSILYCGFVSEEYYRQLQDALNHDEVECYVYFYWNEYLRPKAAEALFKGTPATLKGTQLQNAETYPVYVNHGIWGFDVTKGTLLVVNDHFYYVNHQEAGLYITYSLDTYEFDSLECYEVTDPALLADLEDSMGRFYDVAYASEDWLTLATVGFWVLIFGIIPAGILVLALIFRKRGKGYYRKVWGRTCLFAAAELVMFAVVCVSILLSA